MESKYRTRYTEEQKQEAMRLKSTGLSNEKVAELTGIGVGTIAKMAKTTFPFIPKENPGSDICFGCRQSAFQTKFNAISRH
jgi:hypothetical protein